MYNGSRIKANQKNNSSYHFYIIMQNIVALFVLLLGVTYAVFKDRYPQKCDQSIYSKEISHSPPIILGLGPNLKLGSQKFSKTVSVVVHPYWAGRCTILNFADPFSYN